MKLQPSPGRTVPRSLRGTVVNRIGRGNVIVTSAWPKPRGRNLTPIQLQQVKTWDTVMQLIKNADHLDREQAEKDTEGTAYYVRDLLTVCCFGSYLSWPGFGIYPDGGASGPIPYERSGRAERRDYQLAHPRKVNNVLHTDFITDMGDTTMTVATTFPADPMLLVWDVDPIKVGVPVKRKNKKVNHGNKPFFPQDPLVIAPKSGGGTDWSFDFPKLGPSGSLPPLWYCVAQFGDDSPTHVSWSTMERPHKTKTGILSLTYIGGYSFTSLLPDDNSIDGELASTIAPDVWLPFNGSDVYANDADWPQRIEFLGHFQGQDVYLLRVWFILNFTDGAPPANPPTTVDGEYYTTVQGISPPGYGGGAILRQQLDVFDGLQQVTVGPQHELIPSGGSLVSSTSVEVTAPANPSGHVNITILMSARADGLTERP